MKKSVPLLALVVCFCSCASTYQVENLPSKQQEANQARLVVLRPSIMGLLVSVNVYEDDVFVGKISSRSFLAWNVKPGATILKSGNGYYKINAEPGKSYYLKLRPKLFTFSFGPRFEFDAIAQDDAERKVAQLSKPKVKLY